MKRILILALLLAGCGPTTGDQSTGEVAPASIDPYFYKDRITGCEYLSTRNEQGLAPRITADGKTHMGCKAVAP